MNFNDNFRKILTINNEIINSSKLINEKTKEQFISFSKALENILNENPKLNSYQRKSLTSDFLIYWNETTSIDCEKFWNETEKNEIKLDRKEPLRFLLKNKRFQYVEQAIQIKKHWAELKELKSIQNRYNKNELIEIEDLSTKDEIKRKELLQKCLIKKQIPKIKYLYFGECMAYYAQTELLQTEFSLTEISTLHEIWKNHP